MKKIKLLSIFTLPTLISSSVISLVACNNDESDTVKLTFVPQEGGTISTDSVSVKKGTLWMDCNKPKVIANDDFVFDNWYSGETELNHYSVINETMTITAKFVKLNPTVLSPKLYKCDGGKYTYTEITIPNFVTKFDNVAMGYCKPSDFYAPSIGYTYTESNYVGTITNQIHTNKKSTCVIDFKNQTITFSDYEEFMDSDSGSQGSMTEWCTSGGHAYFNSIVVNEYKKGMPITIDLSRYNIRAIWYQDHGYLPYEIYNNILNWPGSWYGYPMGQWEFNGYDIYQTPKNDANEITYKQLVKEASKEYYSSKYMQYAYSLLAATLDFRFGMTTRKSRAHEGKAINYKDHSALVKLLPYYADIVSTKQDVSGNAVRKAMRKNYDDGGHTACGTLNAFDTKELGNTHLGEEITYSVSIAQKLAQARQAAGHSMPKQGQLGYYESYDSSKGKIGYITFDTFHAPQASQLTNPDEAAAGRELPGDPYTTAENYGEDTMRLTMYANEQIKTDNVKYLVVDLSLNGGGTAFSEHFIASWLCGGVSEKIWNPTTNAYSYYTAYADVNADGKFDENDYISKDIKLFIITSTYSFSCGNILPCNVKDNKPETVFIGHNSGGGPCLVDQSLFAGAASYYQASSNEHILRLASSITNPITVDDGYGLPNILFDEVNNPTAFYDREEINKKIISL